LHVRYHWWFSINKIIRHDLNYSNNLFWLLCDIHYLLDYPWFALVDINKRSLLNLWLSALISIVWTQLSLHSIREGAISPVSFVLSCFFLWCRIHFNRWTKRMVSTRLTT